MNELIISDQSRALTAQKALSADLFSRFISFLDAKPKTVETYTRALRQLFNYLSLNGSLQNPTRDDIIAFREELKASGHKPTTVTNYINATRLFFQWTEQEGLYPNIAAHIKGAKLDRDFKKSYLTSRQVKAVLEKVERDSLHGLRDYAMLVLMVTGGLRTIEVSRANIGDLRTAGDNTVLYVQGKGRDEKTEYIKVDAKVEEALRYYLKARGENNPEAPLFASLSNNSRGQRMTTRAISGVVKEHLREALEGLESAYDVIIVDTPPALGILTINALTACGGCIVPAQPDMYSLQGIQQLYGTLQTVRKYCNPSLKVMGILLTRYNGRAVISREIAEMLEETASKMETRLYRSRIRECTALKEAQAVKESIFSYAPRSNASADYKALIDEIMEEG